MGTETKAETKINPSEIVINLTSVLDRAPDDVERFIVEREGNWWPHSGRSGSRNS